MEMKNNKVGRPKKNVRDLKKSYSFTLTQEAFNSIKKDASLQKISRGELISKKYEKNYCS